jgi:NTE family protein
MHPTEPSAPPPLLTDLVLEGGGVKGVGHVGAVMRLVEAGYSFPRVAGTSAGAIVGALVAALEQAGEPLSRLEDLMRSLDFRRFPDRGLSGRLAWFLGDAVSLLVEDGLYEGDYLRKWLGGVLAGLGVRTFGDLRLPPDPGSDLPESRRYRLLVTGSDLSRQQLVRLPWDYGDYGLDPDSQRVVDAVRISASIPLFFEPVHLKAAAGRVSTLVDGGVLSNYPIALFDRQDGRPPRWPTFGVKLSARLGDRPITRPVRGPLAVGLATVETLLSASDAAYVDDPCVRRRTIFVDSSGVSPVDFDISTARRDRLYAGGRSAAESFLRTWDFPAWVHDCRPGAA